MSPRNQERILVTGGAGFIGSALVWALNGRGRADIVIADFLEPDKRWNDTVPLDAGRDHKRRNLAPLKFAELVEADVLRARLRANPGAFGRFGTVFHLGACSSTTGAQRGLPARTTTSRTRGSWRTGRWRRGRASSTPRPRRPTATAPPAWTTGTTISPACVRSTAYGRSKQLFDLHAQREGLLDRIVGLKYFNVFGPNEDHKGDMRSLVHKAYQQILATGQVRLFKSHRPEFKDGEQQRDFLYVKDAVEMTLHFMEQAPTAAGLYNIGSGKAHTWLELVAPIFAALGRPPAIEFIEMPEAMRDKYQYFTRADITKLRRAGYSRPITPLADAVTDYVTNHLVPGKRLGG